MKIGLILAVSAISLFSGTVIWSTQKTIERPASRADDEEKQVLQPERRSANHFFYPTGSISTLYINAPVAVELDETFTGVELYGDTSLFPKLQITDRHGIVNIGQRQYPKIIGKGPGPGKRWEYPDSIRQQIQDADIRVRVGIGNSGAHHNRILDLKNCKNVAATTPVTGERVTLNLFQVDSTQLDLAVGGIQVYHSGGRATFWLQLSGTADQVFFSAGSWGNVDARRLQAREVYVRNAHHVEWDLYATEIANLQGLDSCTVRLGGNPRYQLIREGNDERRRR